MTCKMDCKCIECRHVELDKFIFLDPKIKGRIRETKTCYHCQKYDKYSDSLLHLKYSNILDNRIYI